MKNCLFALIIIFLNFTNICAAQEYHVRDAHLTITLPAGWKIIDRYYADSNDLKQIGVSNATEFFNDKRNFWGEDLVANIYNLKDGLDILIFYEKTEQPQKTKDYRQIRLDLKAIERYRKQLYPKQKLENCSILSLDNAKYLDVQGHNRTNEIFYFRECFTIRDAAFYSFYGSAQPSKAPLLNKAFTAIIHSVKYDADKIEHKYDYSFLLNSSSEAQGPWLRAAHHFKGSLPFWLIVFAIYLWNYVWPLLKRSKNKEAPNGDYPLETSEETPTAAAAASQKYQQLFKDRHLTKTDAEGEKWFLDNKRNPK